MPTLSPHLNIFIERLYTLIGRKRFDDSMIDDHKLQILNPDGTIVVVDLRKVFEIEEGAKYVKSLPEIAQSFIIEVNSSLDVSSN